MMSSQLDTLPSTSANQRKKRPTIAFFNHTISEDWALQAWQGIVDAAREFDANLVTFDGEIIELGQANVVYDLARGGRLDGLIIWNGGLVSELTEAETKAFCRQYGIPVVVLEGTLAGFPCVTFENYLGLQRLVEHLIQAHGYHKIGFLGMLEHQEGFRERYRGYTDTMQAHGLPIDPTLAKPWFPPEQLFNFTVEAHTLNDYIDNAMALEVEAIICITDTIAYPVLRELQKRGIRVPEQVAVVGFDDNLKSRVITPPLTTIKAPFYESGYTAVETLLDLLTGKSVPELVNVPTTLTVRQSCGCQDPYVAAVTTKPSATLATSPAEAAPIHSDIAAAMMQTTQAGKVENIQHEIEPLRAAFAAELSGEKAGGFLDVLGEALYQSANTVVELTQWHNILSALRQQILPQLNLNGPETRQAEDLLQQAQVFISRATERTQMLRNYRATEKELDFQRVSVSLLTTLDINTLMDTLVNELPGLGIPSCYLSLFENPQPYHYPDPAPAWARLILAYNPQGRTQLQPGGQRLPSRQLIPDEFWSQDRACSFVLLSLHFQEAQIGFVLFESGSRKGRLYETLGMQISSTLKGVLLLQAREETKTALVKAYAEIEQQVKERTAELEHEIAERERLQQEVIESQQRAIQELSTPIIPALEGVIIMPLIGSIDSLRARDITRALLAGISQHQAKVVILDVTGVPLVNSGVANHLSKTIQAAKLKGARTIVTGISEAVAETIVDLGIDWSHIETMTDLQTGLRAVLTGQKRRGGI